MLIERERRMVERRIKDAKFPAVKSLDSFDFTALPSLNKTLVLELTHHVHIPEMNGDRLKQSKRRQHGARAAVIPDSPPEQ